MENLQALLKKSRRPKLRVKLPSPMAMLLRDFVALVHRRCQLSVRIRIRVGVFLPEHQSSYGQTEVFATAGQTSRVSPTAGLTGRAYSTAGHTAAVAGQKTWLSPLSTAGSTVRRADPAARVPGKKATVSSEDQEGLEVRVPLNIGQKAMIRDSSSAGKLGQVSSTEGQTARVLPDDRESSVVRVPLTAAQTGRLLSRSREGQAARVRSTAGQTARVPAGTAGGQIGKVTAGMPGSRIDRVRTATAGQGARILSLEGPSVRVSPPEAQLYGNATAVIPASQAGEQAPAALQSTRKSRASLSIPETAEMDRKVHLLDAAGMTPSDLNMLLQKRAFVSAPFEKLEAVFMVYKKFFGAGDVACKVLAQNSGTLMQPIEQLEQKLKCLEDFQVGGKACMRIGTSRHCVLIMTPESLHNRLSYLQTIGLTADSRNILLCRFPQTLRLSIETSMQPTIIYLESKGMARDAIVKLVVEHPSMLAMSVDKNLSKKFELLGQLGLSSKECNRAIGCLTLPSFERIPSKVEALKRLGFSGEDVLEMLRRKPDLLSRSEDNLNKKFDLLVNVQNRDIKEIVRYPTCLCFHLENRIIPRMNALREKGKVNSYSLASILSTTEASFRRKFNLPNFPPSKHSRQTGRFFWKSVDALPVMVADESTDGKEGVV